MNGEFWIWTELLAFDNTSSDLGVQKYLDHIQTIPDGISILSGYDFVLYHEKMDKEITMLPQVCSRGGHLSNGIRDRQEWTNYQIRALIEELHKHGIKVLLSVFAAPMNKFFGKEFIYDYCPENQYAFIGKLKDKRNAGDFFIEKMNETLQAYNFDGWHVADTIAAPWSILSSPTDNVIIQFAKENSNLNLPSFIFEDNSSIEDEDKRLAKLRYLQQNHWQVWNDWMSNAWMSFWEKLIQMVHHLNKIVMVNSPNTKSIFGALQYMNTDYRKLAELKIDYLLVETTSPGCSLIWHSREYLHEFDAVLSEMTAAMDGVKILMMPSIKDVVENYDALSHTPTLYERDVHFQAAQHIKKDGELKRCADGVIVCLGDCIEYHQWKFLHRIYGDAFSFKAIKAGEVVWLHDNEIFDQLHYNHHQYGTWSPAMQITQIRNYSSIDIATITTIDELSNLSQPIIVPNFFLLSTKKRNQILSCNLPLILTGSFELDEIPQEAEALCWAPPNSSYRWYTIFLNWENLVPGVKIVSNKNLEQFDDSIAFNVYREYYPHLNMPDEFWQKSVARIRELLGPIPLENESDGLQLMRQYSKDGKQLINIISQQHYYTTPQYRIEDTQVKFIRNSRFVELPIGVGNNYLIISDPVRDMPLHLAPKGIMSFIQEKENCTDF